MNSLDRLSNKNKFKKRKQRVCPINSLAVIGVAIGGAIAGLFVRSCCGEIKNIIISNAKDIEEDIEEDTNTKRDEIKQTLDKAHDESVGDVGIAMERAFEDLEDEKQSKDEVIK
ncbi:hypothetical protein G9F73_007500 [Clostridium estertheticum]|uniref:hypothetical protein n=1 Tax=Clostridium estertheticum TaxID=238834 RepID=UPI0013EE4CE2|nr:hypothetical protein [Clostridium estertheticum]MBZ9607659.1 hypothetical protein [Clostridium estertheticum]